MRRSGSLLLMLALGCGSSPEPERPSESRAPALVERVPPEAARMPAPTPPLPEAVTIEARVQSPPHEIPAGAPHAIVHLPAGLDPSRPMELVVFLHGWSGCARVLALSGRVACARERPRRTGWGLLEQHDAAGANSIFIVPQLAFLERTGRPGGFAARGAFRAFLQELLEVAASPHVGARSVEQFGITLVAHSAGYETALAILDHGGADVRAVVLLDALYAGAARFAAWARANDARRLVSLYTGRGSTYRESQILADLVDRAIVEPSPHPHGAIPRRQLADILGRVDPPHR